MFDLNIAHIYPDFCDFHSPSLKYSFTVYYPEVTQAYNSYYKKIFQL